MNIDSDILYPLFLTIQGKSRQITLMISMGASAVSHLYEHLVAKELLSILSGLYRVVGYVEGAKDWPSPPRQHYCWRLCSMWTALHPHSADDFLLSALSCLTFFTVSSGHGRQEVTIQKQTPKATLKPPMQSKKQRGGKFPEVLRNSQSADLTDFSR